MNDRKLSPTIELVSSNINVQRQNAPDSPAATAARTKAQLAAELIRNFGAAVSAVKRTRT